MRKKSIALILTFVFAFTSIFSTGAVFADTNYEAEFAYYGENLEYKTYEATVSSTDESVLEEAAGFGLQLLIMQTLVHLDKAELVLRNVFKIVIHITHFLDPILIRGSIKP